MKIAYCGYDFFSACLSDLFTGGFPVHSIFTMECDNRIDYNQYIHEIAAQHGLPVEPRPINTDTVQRLVAEDYDLLITAGYRYKIPDLAGTPLRGINIHPTLLPVGRGPMPLPWIILKKFEHSGVSIHALTPSFDAGAVLHQASFPIATHENLESLSAKCQLTAQVLLREVVADFDRYWSNQQPQTGKASYWPRPAIAERSINWCANVEEIDRLCRAFGKSGVRATFDNQSWLVYSLTAWQEAHRYAPGTVVHKTNTEMIIAAADGLVDLLYFRRLAPPEL